MPTRKTNRHPDPDHPPSALSGKDEINLAEFPFASLRNRGDKRKAIIYEGWITDADGNRCYQEWITQGGSLVGIPNEFDERVFIALVALTAEQGFASRRVTISLYQVIAIMGLVRSRNTYQYLENSLERLLAATFRSKQALWNHDTRERVTTVKGFHLIEGYWLRYKEVDREIAEEEGVPGYFVWSEVIWKSFKAGYIKNLDLAFFYSLQSPVSRRLYRFLDKRMQYQDEYDKKYTRLRFRKGAGPVAVENGPVAATNELPAELEDPGRDERGGFRDEILEVVQQLTDFGIGPTVAKRLASRYPSERIYQKLEYLGYIQETSPKTIVNPRGWLRRAVEEDFGPPDGYQTSEEKEVAAAKQVQREREREEWLAAHAPEQREMTWLDQVKMAHEVPESFVALTRDLQTLLQSQVTTPVYSTWLKNLLILRRDRIAVTIAVPNQAAHDWLTHKLRKKVEAALTALVGEPVDVRFTVTP